MGRRIDRAVLTAVLAAVLYLLFVSAFGNIIVACCLSFICCVLLFQIRRSRGEKFTMTRHQAQTILETWAYGRDEDAKAQIESLINRSDTLIYLTKHPTAALSIADVFSAWKSHRDNRSIIITAACHSDGRARTFAATLQNPSVEIVDAARLILLIRRSNIPPPAKPRTKETIRKLQTLLSELPCRRPWYRNFFAGLGLILVYLFTGSAGYLILSIGTLFISGIGLRRHV